MKTLLCRLGIHRPLQLLRSKPMDMSTWELVWFAKCPCGKSWITFGISRWFSTKVRTIDKE